MKNTGCVVGLLFMLMGAAFAQDVPKAEVYLGYSYLRTATATQVNAFNNNGGLSALQYNFNHIFSLVGEFGGYQAGDVSIHGPSFGTLDATFFSYQFGPRVSLNKTGRVTPFFQYLVGGVHESRSFNIPTSIIPSNFVVPRGVTLELGDPTSKIRSTQNAFAMTVGGGFDIKVSRLISIRPAQVDYLPTHFSPFNLPGVPGNVNNTRWQHNLRYSAGVAFRFGGAPPAVPTASCTGAPLEVLPDDPPVAVSMQTAQFNPKHALNYSWATTGGQVVGSGSSVKIEPAGVTPGNYTVTATATDPKQKSNNVATCTASFTVKQPQPPVVACSASPTSVEAGKPVAITVQGSSPDGRRIESRKFSTTAGAIQEGQTSAGGGPGQFTSTATLDTSSAPPGAPINVNMSVTDVRGLTGTCTASIDVQALPTPVAETLTGQCDFQNARKPNRVDNSCKALLDDASLRLQRDLDGKLVVVGYADQGEKQEVVKEGAVRAVNAKFYLVSGEGRQQVDPNRIEVRRASELGGRKAEVYFVPGGGNFTKPGTEKIDENEFKIKGRVEPAPKQAPVQTSSKSGTQ